MSRRRPPAEKRRGRHKKRGSAETLRWQREHQLPAKPEWMSATTYAKLAQLRADL